MALLYTPILRARQEEMKILKSFDFGDHIYPCVEIFKEIDRAVPTHRKGIPLKKVKQKTFEDVYIELLGKIKAKKIFVDLPVHLKEDSKMDAPVINFLRTVVSVSTKRNQYIQKLKSLSDKIIPVVSTYYQRTGKANTITYQEIELRKDFKQIAFRVFPETFLADMKQVDKVATKNDYLIVDLNTLSADPEDDDLEEIIEQLKKFDICHVIIVRAAMDYKLTNTGLRHDDIVKEADNSLLLNFRKLMGDSFGDYAGIKKDNVLDGGTVSPGFVYYDAVKNEYYGFKGRPQKTPAKKLAEFENTIVPAVIACQATKRMINSGLAILTNQNNGWQQILAIDNNIVSGKNQAKFKGISMAHYLHCIRSLINAGKIK